jgi:hypothetical protein
MRLVYFFFQLLEKLTLTLVEKLVLVVKLVEKLTLVEKLVLVVKLVGKLVGKLALALVEKLPRLIRLVNPQLRPLPLNVSYF